jgi:hypothetical protein
MRNCMLFWSRRVCSQPCSFTTSPTCCFRSLLVFFP